MAQFLIDLRMSNLIRAIKTIEIEMVLVYIPRCLFQDKSLDKTIDGQRCQYPPRPPQTAIADLIIL